MSNWSVKRRWSFFIHLSFVTVPFLASALSSFALWRDLFGGWYYAVPMVLTVDILALAGLALYIARIPSPFVPLRHMLPVVSVVPLARELYLLLAHNGAVIAAGTTAIVITIFTWIAWQCWRTIEQLFVSPVEAASEQARERLEGITVALAQLTAARDIATEFASGWQVARPARLPAAPAVVRDSTPVDVVTAPAPEPDSTGKTAKVKALAAQHGVSESTAWRNVRRGRWTID